MKKKITNSLLYLCFLPPLLIYLTLFSHLGKIYPSLLTLLNLLSRLLMPQYKDKSNCPEKIIPSNNSIIYIYSNKIYTKDLFFLMSIVRNKLFLFSIVNYCNNSSFLISFILNKMQEASNNYKKIISKEEKHIKVIITSDEHYYSYWKKNKNCISLTVTSNNNEIILLFDQNN